MLEDLLWLLAKSVLLSAVALILIGMIRRYASSAVSSAVRHSICVGVWVALLSLPLLSSVLPAWRTVPAELMPLPEMEVSAGGDIPVSSTVPTVADTGLTKKVVPATGEIRIVDKPNPVPTIRAVSSVPFYDKPPVLGVTDCFTLLYIAIVLFLLIRLTHGHLVLWSIVRRAKTLPYETDTKIPVRESPEITVPLTVGCGRWAVIVLPNGFTDTVTKERLQAVLAHEIAHIQRSDYATQLFADGVWCLYFANPLAWLLTRGLRDEAERAADDRVLTETLVRPSDYAAYLLETVRALQKQQGILAYAVAMARMSEVGTRIQAILAKNVSRVGRISIPALVSLGVACIAGTGGVAILAPAMRVFAEEAVQPSSPKEFKHIFSDGTAVQVVAVYNGEQKAGKAQYIWRPDGSRYTGQFIPGYESEYSENTDFVVHSNFKNKERVIRTVAIHITGPRSNANDFDFAPQWQTDAQTQQHREVGVLSKSESGQFATVKGKFAPTERNGAINIRLARTNWGELASFTVNEPIAKRVIQPTALYRNSPPIPVEFRYLTSTAQGIGVQFKCPEVSLLLGTNTLKTRVMAQCTDGKDREMYMTSGSSSSEVSEYRLADTHIQKEQIKSFRLEGRVYDSVTFSNIKLTSDTPAKVPGNTHTRILKDGTTFEVLAIARHPSWKQAGGQWWRPDGTPLPGIPPYAPSPLNNDAKDNTKMFFNPKAFNGKRPEMYDIICRVTGAGDRKARSLHWGSETMDITPGPAPYSWEPRFIYGYNMGSWRGQQQGERFVIHDYTFLAVQQGTQEAILTLRLSAPFIRKGVTPPSYSVTIPHIALHPSVLGMPEQNTPAATGQ